MMIVQHSSELSDSLVLGIDTGGTYTDAVLMEYYSRRVWLHTRA